MMEVICFALGIIIGAGAGAVCAYFIMRTDKKEAEISKSYVDNIDDGNAYEYDVRYNGLNAFDVADMLKRNGISDYTIDETTNTVQVLDFDLSGDIELETKIKNLINEMGGNYYGTDYRPVQSSYLDARSRERAYSKWLDESGIYGSSSLRDYISQSRQKVQEFIRKNAGTEVTNEAGANYSMREIEQMYIAKGWKRANKPAGTGFVTITFRHNPQMKPSETDSDK